MIRKIFCFIVLFLNVEIYGMSPAPFPDGDVNITSRNNEPCIYIDREDLIGGYVIYIYSYDRDNPFEYKSAFDKNYPVKDKCIPMNTQNFPGIDLRENVRYEFKLIPQELVEYEGYSAYIKSNFTGLSGAYCFKKIDGQMEVQDFNYRLDKCVDRTVSSDNGIKPKKQKSWWYLLITWFMDLWFK